MKLEQIKRHPDFPFRNFHSDDLQFLMLELYWAELLREILPESVAADWGPEWPADPEDGNPILSVSNRRVIPPRMLRIIQNVNAEEEPIRYRDPVYAAFVPGMTYGQTDQDIKTPIEELVILSEVSEVSEVCERMVRDYIRLWCVERISEDRMDEVVTAYWARAKANRIDPPEEDDEDEDQYDGTEMPITSVCDGDR